MPKQQVLTGSLALALGLATRISPACLECLSWSQQSGYGGVGADMGSSLAMPGHACVVLSCSYSSILPCRWSRSRSHNPHPNPSLCPESENLSSASHQFIKEEAWCLRAVR